MGQVIKLKRSNIAGAVPSSTQLEVGEVALNMADALLYFKEPSGTIKQLKVTSTLDIPNVLSLDNTNEYTPTSDYHPATKAYVDLAVLQSLVGLKTTDRIEIINDEITLPSVAFGDIYFNSARIYNDLTINCFFEVTCSLNEEKTKVLFDHDDNLNGKYCVVSYITFKS